MDQIYKFKITQQFEKSFSKLPKHIQRKAKIKYALFKQNIYHPTLRTHKLKGILANHYSFSVNYEYRIVFRIEDNFVILLDVGTHKIYK